MSTCHTACIFIKDQEQKKRSNTQQITAKPSVAVVKRPSRNWNQNNFFYQSFKKSCEKSFKLTTRAAVQRFNCWTRSKHEGTSNSININAFTAGNRPAKHVVKKAAQITTSRKSFLKMMMGLMFLYDMIIHVFNMFFTCFHETIEVIYLLASKAQIHKLQPIERILKLQSTSLLWVCEMFLLINDVQPTHKIESSSSNCPRSDKVEWK